MKVKFLTVYSIALIICASFCFGFAFSQKTIEPQVITKPEPYWVIQKVRVYIDRIAYQESQLRDFESTQELEDWLAQDDTDHHIILKADKEGIIRFNGSCEDAAIQLMDRAIADGFKMSFYVMGRGEYYDHYHKCLKSDRLHAVNLVVIGNEVYLIEPQTDEYWLKAYLDPA